MNERYFGATDTGRVRQNNEDAFFVQPVLGGAFLAACVIDGVGGYEGGEVAAQIARDVLPDYLRIPSGEVLTMMQEAMVAANDKILAEKAARPDLSDMACVLTLVLTEEERNQFHFVHVGDTRLYLFRDGSLVKVTKDQSFVGFLEDSGRLSEAEAMNHPKRNEINKALGFDAQVRNTRDYFDYGTSPFLPGDLLLLCSDGLTDLVPAAAMTEVLSSEDSLKQKVERLIVAANQAGGKDNITVVLVQHSKQPRKQRALKPKKKPAAKQAIAPMPSAPVASKPQPQVTEEKPVKSVPAQPIRGSRGMWVLGFLCLLLAAALGWLLYLQWKGANKDKGEQTAAELQLLELLGNPAGDTVQFASPLINSPVSISDTVRIQKDTLRILGNGLHLVAGEGFEGAAILLTNQNRFVQLQDITLENFTVGLYAKGQRVQLQNVRFLNCTVPVQYGYSVPVNSPVNVTISDSLFSTKDSISR